jgi:hypothetical protein
MTWTGEADKISGFGNIAFTIGENFTRVFETNDTQITERTFAILCL